jgi:hypothetical protein
VTALKFYAATVLNAQEKDKFIITNSVYPSDDDQDVDIVSTPYGGKFNGNGIN